ncbi:hypothetical protein BDQ17DRAFT_1303000 [Cyathus striatus]|nr:hypothetical protein BDQ17DRAFT_1303000 [Cyathus striatus]
MRIEIKSLRRRNKELERKHRVCDIHSQSSPTTSKGSATARIKSLENTIEDLKLSNRKFKKKIEKLRAKELKAEAAELNADGSDQEPGDAAHRMTKLLRRFSDLMLVTTLGENEDCPICLERLVLNKCSSLPCQHLFCNGCLPNISRAADETVKCPQCRRSFSREEVELVHLTESARWDQLLDVAQAWDAFDHRGEEETSDEEASENFIVDDDEGSETVSAVAEAQTSEIANEEGSDDDRLSTPPAPEQLSYSQSPSGVKRRRLEDMIQQRHNKKRK